MAYPDDLSLRLESLEADLGPTGLPGPSAARRRGHQRVRRRNAAVGSLAVAVVAGAVAVPADWETDGSREPAPAEAVPSTTPSSTPTTTAAESLTEEMLLTPEDLEPEDADPLGWEITWDTDSPGDAPVESFACAPEATSAAAEMLMRSLAVLEDGDPWEGRADQLVERFDDPAAAQGRFDELREVVLACAQDLDAGPVPPEHWTWNGVGDQAWLARYWTAADAPEGYGELVEISLIRTGATVTIIAKGFHAMDANLPMPPDLAISATERLCGPAGGSCVEDPQPADESGDLHGEPTSEAP